MINIDLTISEYFCFVHHEHCRNGAFWGVGGGGGWGKRQRLEQRHTVEGEDSLNALVIAVSQPSSITYLRTTRVRKLENDGVSFKHS